MSERLNPCLELDSRPECEKCTGREKLHPSNWPTNVSLPCIIEVEKAIEEGESKLRALVEERRKNQPPFDADSWFAPIH